MNPVSVGLTVAWLDAFRQMGTRKTLLDEAKLPDGERTLSETIASALRIAGAEAAPDAEADSAVLGQAIDKLV